MISGSDVDEQAQGSNMDTNASKMHDIRVKAEDEIERLLLDHHASHGAELDRERLRYNMDLAIAATIVENKMKARGSSKPGA